jgi:hypothetical protein
MLTDTRLTIENDDNAIAEPDFGEPEGVLVNITGSLAHDLMLSIERKAAEHLIGQIQDALALLDDPEERAIHKPDEASTEVED